MRPRGMPSRWLKLRPWHYTTERRQPTRAAEFRRALIEEDEPGEIVGYKVDGKLYHPADVLIVRVSL